MSWFVAQMAMEQVLLLVLVLVLVLVPVLCTGDKMSDKQDNDQDQKDNDDDDYDKQLVKHERLNNIRAMSESRVSKLDSYIKKEYCIIIYIHRI